MGSHWRVALLAAGLAAAAGGVSLAQDPDREEGSVGGGPPPPPPRADPSAGNPAYLADFEDRRSMVLDARGRVVRVLPRRVAAGARLCGEGSRRVADAGEWTGVLQIHRLDGTRLWHRRIPIAYVSGLRCLGRRGGRAAVVTEAERRPISTLRIVSRGGSRVVLRTRRQIPTLTDDRVYATDRSGVHIRALADGRTVRDVATPAAPHRVLPSPDGRWLALTHLNDDLEDRSYLVDVTTGEVRAIEIPRVTLLGWLANDRLAVRSDKHLRELDTSLRAQRTVPGFAPASAVTSPAGDVIATDGTALVRVRRDAGRVERIGTVPKGTFLRDVIF